MDLSKNRFMALGTVFAAVVGCSAPPPESQTEAAPPEAAQTENEGAVFEEDFEQGDAEEWAETAVTDAPADDEPEADPGSESDKD